MMTLFKYRVFVIVASADLLQQVGIWIRNMALLFYIMEQTNNNPTAVSMLTALEYLPIFLFSLIGGTFADRWEPKKTVIIGDLLSAVSILLIFSFVLMGVWQAVFAATVVSAIVSQFSQPSSAVLFRKHIPSQYTGTAIGITQSMMAVFTILGPILGTFIYTQFGLYTSLMILLGIFLLAALIQLFLPSSTREISRNVASALIDLKAGLHYVFNHRNLRLIAGLFFINGIAIGLTQPLDVFVTLERLELPKESVQWFSASEGVGMLLGGILAAMCMSLVERHRQRVITGTLVVWSILTIIEVLSVWPLLTASARILSGIATAFFQVIFSALLIKEVNPDYIGRANGVIVPLMMAGILIGTATSGLFLALSSLFVVYSISALLTLLSCVLALKMTSDSKRAHH